MSAQKATKCGDFFSCSERGICGDVYKCQARCLAASLLNTIDTLNPHALI